MFGDAQNFIAEILFCKKNVLTKKNRCGTLNLFCFNRILPKTVGVHWDVSIAPTEENFFILKVYLCLWMEIFFFVFL